MNPEYVEQMVSFKYSPIGTSYGDRIRRVFNNVPFIYGFDSKAPLAEDISSYLTKYLKVVGPRYAQIWESDDPQRHQGLLDIINSIPDKKMIQEPGLKLRLGEKIPACFLNDPQVTNLSKLTWIDQALTTDQRLEYIPDAGDFLGSQRNYQWSSQENSVLNHISSNEQAQSDVVGLLKTPMNGFLGVQIKMLNLLQQVNWISGESFQSLLHNLVIGDLKKHITSNRLDAVCSLNLNVFPILKMSEIPETAWHQENFLSLLGCLSVKDPEIQKNLLEIAGFKAEVLFKPRLPMDSLNFQIYLLNKCLPLFPS